MDVIDKDEKFPFRRKLQLVSALLLLLSAVPCGLTFLNIRPVILYAIQQQENVSLQLYFPLCSASCVAGIGVILLIVSLFLPLKSKEDLFQG
jgi:hypothetical protein